MRIHGITAASALALALAVAGGVPSAALAVHTAGPGRAATAIIRVRTTVMTATPLPLAAKLLYSQDNDPAGYGTAVVSQNFGKGHTTDSQAADDFTVPTGNTWTITQVNVAGYEAGGTPASENVFVYKNTVNSKKRDVPGKLVRKQTLKGRNSNGSLVITGITGVKLAAGHYWLSVQANLAIGSGLWGWDSRTKQHSSPAVWENPGNGFSTGCTTWTPYRSCTDESGGPDLMFALYGASAS